MKVTTQPDGLFTVEAEVGKTDGTDDEDSNTDEPTTPTTPTTDEDERGV